jgi:DNA/RNA-binding domain of Phe-tRNA-synthetase-like protein
LSIFEYDPDLLVRFPSTIGGVLLGHGLYNGPTPPALLERYQAEQRSVAARLGDTPLSQLAPIAAWRGVFSGFGVEPTKYRSAPESLLRRLTKKGDIPSINLLVDLGNLVSIRYALPVAVFDTRQITGRLLVKSAAGTERFTVLKETGNAVEHPEPGEVIFADDTDLVFARRWCWRQSETSAAQTATTEIIVTVEAQHPGGRSDVQAALADLLALLKEYAGGSYTNGILDATNLRLSD